jgi:hypothetical protein
MNRDAGPFSETLTGATGTVALPPKLCPNTLSRPTRSWRKQRDWKDFYKARRLLALFFTLSGFGIQISLRP